jgi:hypothetical protein
MKKQKKKIKKAKFKLKIVTSSAKNKKLQTGQKECHHYHLNNDGSCCHCGKLSCLFDR